MKVATRLSMAFGILVVVLAGLLVYHVRTIHHVVSANYELSELSARLYVSTTRQLGALSQLEENASKFRVTRDAGYLELFHGAFRDFDAGLRTLASYPLTADERAEVARLEQLWREFRPLAERLDAEPPASAPPALALAEQLASLRFQARRVSEASQAAMRARLEASATAGRRAERISWVAAAGALLLSVLVFWGIVRSISSALSRLQRGTHEVAQGNFDYRLPADRDDEFAQVARDFNVMTRRVGELDRMKRDFLSKVSHDLKTPLASMQETVRVMLDGVPGPVTARQRRLLELTDQSAHRLSGMIAKLLDLSTMQAGALELEIGRHDAREVLQPAVDAVAPTDPRIELELPAVPLRLECDRDRMVQVLVNLLENAVRFSPVDAPIRVRARYLAEWGPGVPESEWERVAAGAEAPGRALIEVADRGPGIPDADKARVFEHFFQSGNGGRAARRSVGLGLAICREILELHGGAVWVDDNPGGGSVFSVLLPGASLDTGSLSMPAFVHGTPLRA